MGVFACGQVHRSGFPDGGGPVQYGLGVFACAVYLTDYQQWLFKRTAELLNAVAMAGRDISPGCPVRGPNQIGRGLDVPRDSLAKIRPRRPGLA